MILISHRGNINGRIPELENTKDYIDKAISKGYDVEIDIWFWKDNFWLGHDEPQYPVSKSYLIERYESLWIHCKNFDALTRLLEYNLKLFFHEKEEYTIISNKYIWAHNIFNISKKCIIPLLSKKSIKEWTPINVYGVCSDYIELLK
tara:strand:+ start:1023 stop:1463 length:441 start_codon:yes stop_codon:yes gene_type:complete